MGPAAKIGVVGAGYVGAVAIAAAVVAAYVAATDSPDRDAYGGMYAFGDMLLFLAVFGLAAVLPTGVALFFLRPYHAFWRALSVAALTVAATAVPAIYDYLMPRVWEPGAVASGWSAFTVLRLLISPLFALPFLVATVMSPSRRPRLALLAATAIEGSAFVAFVIALVRSATR